MFKRNLGLTLRVTAGFQDVPGNKEFIQGTSFSRYILATSCCVVSPDCASDHLR